uniref:Uncharacterized protein n=1 Tax=Anguilla anguilla TaxID=7936 RepID=A0A0E9VSE5_ANGAN
MTNCPAPSFLPGRRLVTFSLPRCH